MATYATDLTVLNACDSATGWSELPAPHAAGSAPSADTENYFHNGTSISQATGQGVNQTAGIQYDHGSALTWTAASNWVIMLWTYYAAPTNLKDWSTGGMRLGIGSSDNNGDIYNAMGNDFGTYPYGGWQNTAIDPEFATADQTIGTGGGTYRNFIILPNITAKITKGSPLAVDVLRYGRGEFQVTGTGATFDGMATANDNATTGRWGLFQLFGKAYDWKGLMSLGLTGTSVTFTATNITINIQDTPRVLAGFNQIEINHTSSSVTWTTVAISGIETSITGSAPVSPGGFEVVDNATVSKTSCTFTDMGTFAYLSNSTIITSTYRRCLSIVQGGAVFTGCIFDESEANLALIVDDLDIVTDCTFNSDGTGHAVDLGTIASTQSIAWDNSDSSYAGTDGSTGNETIVVSVNTGITLTINVGAGYTTPTIKNDGVGTVTVVSGQVTLGITVKDIVDASLLEDARVYVTAAAGGSLSVGTVIIDKDLTNASGYASDTRSYSTNQPIEGRVRLSTDSPFYRTAKIAGTIDNAAGLALTIQMIKDQ